MIAQKAISETPVVEMLPLSNELAPVLETAQVEVTKEGVQLLRSNYADWPKAKVIRKFWRLYVFGLAAGLAGMYIGYTLSAPGNIVANQGEFGAPETGLLRTTTTADQPGFINQFGTVHNPTTGELELDAKYVSFWSGFNMVSQILSQAISPIIGDRFGRRVNMYLYTASMIVVSRPPTTCIIRTLTCIVR